MPSITKTTGKKSSLMCAMAAVPSLLHVSSWNDSSSSSWQWNFAGKSVKMLAYTPVAFAKIENEKQLEKKEKVATDERFCRIILKGFNLRSC